MKVTVDITDEAAIAVLDSVAKDQLWHINYIIKLLRNNYKDDDTPNHLNIDLRDFFETFNHTNKLIKYFGGEPVEPYFANVKVGYDLDGNPFHPLDK